MAESKSQRTKLKIISVQPIETVGDNKKKLPILCLTEKNEQLLHSIFNIPSLIEYVQQNVGEIIDADVKTSQKGEWTNRNITQIYVDGKPLLERQSRGGYGGGISNEAANVIADAILRASALREMGNIICLSMNDEADIELYTTTARNILKNPSPKPAAAAPAPQSSPKQSPKTSNNESKPVAHFGDLLTRAYKIKVTKPQVEEIIKKKDPGIFETDLSKEQLQVLWKDIQAYAEKVAAANQEFDSLPSAANE